MRKAALWVTGSAVALSLSAAAGNPSTASQQTDLLKRARDRILTLLYVAQEETVLYQGCLTIEAGKPDYRWLSDRRLDIAVMSELCPKKLGEFRSEISKRLHEMRIELALVAPTYRENRILDDLSTRIRTRIRHPFFATATIAPLDAAETAEALAEYQKIVDRARAEYAKKNPNSVMQYASALRGRPISDPWEESFVLAQIEKARKEYGKRYLESVAELPLTIFLPRVNPSSSELARALQEIQDSNAKMIARIEKSQLTDDSIYIGYLPVMDTIVAESPELSQAQKEWRASFDRYQRNVKIAEGTVKAGLWIGGFLLDGEIFGPILEVLETAEMAYDVINTAMTMRERYIVLSSLVHGQVGAESVERMNESTREIIIAHLVIANWIKH